MAKTNLLLIAFFLLSAVAHGRFLVKLENSDLLSKRFPSETSDNGEATIIKLPSDRMENEIRTNEADSADPIIPSDGDFSEGFHHHHHHHHRFFWRRLWHHVFSHCHGHHRFHRFHHGIGFHHGIRPEVDALEREYVIRRSEPDDDEISARHIPFYLVNEENVNTRPFPHPQRHFHHLRRLPGKRWIPAYRHEDQDGEMEVHAVKSSYPTDFESIFEIMKEKNEDLEDERNLGQEPSFFPAMFEHDKMKHHNEDKDEKFEHSFPVMQPGDHHHDEDEEKDEKFEHSFLVMQPGDHHHDEDEEKEEEEKSFPMRMMQEHHHHHHHDENEVEPEGFPMKMHEHHHHHHGEERRFPVDSGSGFKKTAGEEGGVGGWFQKLVKYFE